MVADAIAGLGALKTAFDIVKALKDTNDAVVRTAAIVDLQQQLFAALTAQSELTERIRELEARIVDFETWAAEKQRYELAELSPRVFAYPVKEAMRGGEPFHCLCAACYQQGKKSILQSEGISWGTETLHCAACSADIKVSRPGEGLAY